MHLTKIFEKSNFVSWQVWASGLHSWKWILLSCIWVNLCTIHGSCWNASLGKQWKVWITSLENVCGVSWRIRSENVLEFYCNIETCDVHPLVKGKQLWFPYLYPDYINIYMDDMNVDIWTTQRIVIGALAVHTCSSLHMRKHVIFLKEADESIWIF